MGCSFLALTFSQARRVADQRRWWRQEPRERTESTTNGFPSQRCATLQPVGKPPRGSGRIRLVLTLTEEGKSLFQRPPTSDPDTPTTWIICNKPDTAFLSPSSP